MGIFGRKRGERRRDAEGTPDPAASGSPAAADGGSFGDGAEPAAEQAGRVAGGPFDESEMPHDPSCIDLGGLRLSPIEGLQLRIEVDESQQNVTSVTGMLGDSAVQMQVFAAPRTEGIWAQIRDEIGAGMAQQGATTEVVDGPLGPELSVTVPTRGAAPQRYRFVGVDGPRWFLRAVFTGSAARLGEGSSPLFDLVRSAVVVRGDEAMAPRELIPLKVPAGAGLPPQPADQQNPPGQRHADGDELRPFERGPEITEVR